MELLTIRHIDFVLTIECSKFDVVWNKAKSNIGEQELYSTYSWSEGVTSVVRYSDNEALPIEKGSVSPAIFFDNVDYPIWVEFENYVSHAQFGSELQDDNERFSFRRHILAGFLNYGNDIGRSEIRLIYRTPNGTKHFTFSFEVLSSKLNYHEHWRAIVEDIEAEYRMLSLDYMRRTFHGFSPDVNGETKEIIWWSLFASEQQKFLSACKSIIDRPRHRLHRKESFQRADRLVVVPRSMENVLAEHRRDARHLYRVEEQMQSNDSQENRFMKFALGQITARYDALYKNIVQINNLSEVKRRQMDEVQNSLHRMQRNPFFRTIGKFKGLSQESLVLQKATGYSQVYRTWNILRRGYSLYDGLYRLQSKDIATLYEIWCFIEVSHVVKEQLHLTADDIEHQNRMEMNNLFTWNLGKGERSRILFKKGDVELAELVYNPKSEREDSSVGLQNLVVRTVPQKPDIVLQLTKNDVERGMKMTYLFDAKYRIADRQRGVDTPPDDAINQMHRYRDAIYYKEHDASDLKKEVIGGYILFPGDGESAEVQQSQFFKSISEVNIGAFPLRPKDQHNRELLAEFIAHLIDTKSGEIISKVIPQKGTFVEVGNRLLIGLVTDSIRKGYLQSFLDGKATLYYTGRHFPTTIPLQDLHYFMPYIKDTGIRDLYEIVRVRTISGREAKQMDDVEDVNDIRLAFELRFVRRKFDPYQHINTHKMSANTFIDTTFDELNGLMIQN